MRDPRRLEGTGKVRDTRWAAAPKPWIHYPGKKRTTSAESHLLYELGRTLGPGRYADVGTYWGGSAAAMAHGLFSVGQPGTIYAVDLYSDDPTLEGSQSNSEAPRMLTDYVRSKLPGIRVETWAADSQWLGWSLKVPFRCVFLDADHSEVALREDVAAWGRLVDLGGILAFHDTDMDSVDAVVRSLPSCWEPVHHVYSLKTFRRVSDG